uniref:Uncharacterized protein n=1 Tax=Acidobacterium capsulatum TaxID=33075 RepID=A0A7V5CSA2_9BACT
MILFTSGITCTGQSISPAQAQTMYQGNVWVTLTRTLASHKLEPGALVTAKTNDSVPLSSSIVLPKGTLLEGKVLGTRRLTRKSRTEQIIFAFQSAVIKHQEPLPIHALVVSAEAPAIVAMAGMGDTISGAGSDPAWAIKHAPGDEDSHGSKNGSRSPQDSSPAPTMSHDHGQMSLSGFPVDNAQNETFASTTAGGGSVTFTAVGQHLILYKGFQMRLELLLEK